MEISFAASDRSTLGIEWEVAIVDRQTGDLANVADVVLEALRSDDGALHPHITGELLRNTVELVSGVHTSVRDAVADLQDQLRQVREITDPMGLDLVCSGTHPFAQWFDQAITDKERYHRLIDRTQWWGRNMMIWGIHVHVGIEHRDKVLPILNSLLDYYPHLQALSASSPFWGGVDTGYASNRALMFQQLPTAGLPPQFGAWANYEEYVDDMMRTGVIDDHTEVRWDIRPSPQWGTLEMRACDGLSSAEEIGAVAALIQCLVEHLSSRLDAGEDLPTMQPWYVRENKWRAARYGLDAEIILDAAGAERLVTDDIRDLLVTLAPVAERLDCVKELGDVELILVAGASYQRQLRTAAANDGDLKAVVRALAGELRDGLRDPRS
ncbi:MULTISPECIES: glutamate--cysteine ligase [unclassified Rathayibacter]|uniref:glutamate--cysteine ligase n=1 Tax=unclassified Rathayibacter TaxID=2609250 RepID=UPI000CE7ADBA|nr:MULTISPECIES: glutamate--cysteine ligase [unclassified Rathayibacter]PPF27127.1 glutamate--cysteine ligase [Rathayibacter sp. AY1F2]PPF70393.1 glutamate--cysteine ligase [Rathayibacter sp. AY1E6]PPG40234.1 glutamate--cysteine ligase [Rathayibacter sp. AY2B5]PPH17416.1 glutamate--cysteine ligase [Rathayibacter sp. AY1F8]PPH44436.1 glutamate--cysteine ligase [Rathayibacter sp. AY1F7]